jgi:hypothetical protein
VRKLLHFGSRDAAAAGLRSTILRLRSGFRLAARTPPEQLKMYYFALEFVMEIV